MSDMNSRKNTRVIYKNIATLVLNKEKYLDCRTDNLSLRSVFLPGIVGPVIDQIGFLKIELDRKNKLVICADVKVVRADAAGVALEFISIDTDSYYHLKKVVLYNSADPDSVAEEII